jgi:glutamate synthase domain-containing protein 1
LERHHQTEEEVKKHKRRLSFLDVGGIPVQPNPEEQTQQVDPDAESRAVLKANAARILAENEAIARQVAEARAKRIEDVRSECDPGEFERVEYIVRTAGYPAGAIASGAAWQWALQDVINERVAGRR